MSGARYVGLYPRAWRERYGGELEDLLRHEPLKLRTRVDLVRGAIDAHLHPPLPSPVPVLAAVTASALAVAHAIALLAQPVPTDWPGYQEEALPLIIGSVGASIPALVGAWLKLGDADGALGRAGVTLAVLGHGAWLVALLAAASHLAYGAITAATATVALAGTAILGVALVGRGRFVLGALLAAVGLAGVAPPAWGWAAFACAWTAAAFVVVVDRAAGRDTVGGPRVA